LRGPDRGSLTLCITELPRDAGAPLALDQPARLPLCSARSRVPQRISRCVAGHPGPGSRWSSGR